MLDMFTGTEHYHKFTKLGYVCTDGVLTLAQEAKCFWLLDAIVSYQGQGKLSSEFQVWTLSVFDRKGVLTGTDEQETISQEIPFTDFPLETVKLYLINDVLLLPSEY
jgi:hypothetical protein